MQVNLRNIDLNLLTVFDAVASEGNISRAAAKIGMSQPAMSAALSRLRLTLKDELFVRTGRGVRPTPRALELERPIRRILHLIDDTLTQSAEFDYRASERVFTMASMDYAGILLLPDVLKRLRDMASPMTMNVCSSNDLQLADKLRFGSVDFAVDYIPIVDEDFHSVKIAAERACCLVDPEHPFIRDSLNLEDFLRSRQAVLLPYDKRVSIIDEYLKSLDVARHRTVTVPSMLNYPYVIAGSDLLCTLPLRIGQVFAREHDLKLFPLPLPDFSVDYYLIWHNGQDHDPAHRWMREMLIELSNTLPDTGQ